MTIRICIISSTQHCRPVLGFNELLNNIREIKEVVKFSLFVIFLLDKRFYNYSAVVIY